MPGFTGFVAILFSFNCQRQDYNTIPRPCQSAGVVFTLSENPAQRFHHIAQRLDGFVQLFQIHPGV